jgi:hypothetical protein
MARQFEQVPRLLALHLLHNQLSNRAMERKTETVNLRVTPELKELIRLAAEREHRAIANFIDVLVREHCQKHGIAVPAKQSESC